MKLIVINLSPTKTTLYDSLCNDKSFDFLDYEFHAPSEFKNHKNESSILLICSEYWDKNLDEFLEKLKSKAILVLNNLPELQDRKLLNSKILRIFLEPIDLNLLYIELKKWSESFNSNSQLLFKANNKLQRIDTQEIISIETEGNYSYLYTEQKKIVLKKSLVKVLKEINSKDIVQVFRNVAINMNMIATVDFSNENILLKNGKKLPLGISYKKKLKNKLTSRFTLL